MSEKTNVVIIGAGPAGLTAAYELLSDECFNVVILEESDSIGGISKTVKYNGSRMDIGGHRFFSKDERVMQWWEKVMPIQGYDAYDDKILGREKPLAENGPDPEKVDEVMLIRERVSRIYYLKKFFDYPISLKFQTFKNMGLWRTIKAGFSYVKSVFFKREENSLEDFYINRFGKVLYSMFFEKYTEKLWGRPTKEIAPDWGAQRVKGLSILVLIKDMFSKSLGKKIKSVETSLIEQFWYPKLGPGQLWENVAKKIEDMGGKILKNSAARKINFIDGKISSIETENGEIISGDIFISSMPVKDLVEGMPEEEVPENIKRIASGLPYRDFITVGIKVKKLNLKNSTDKPTLNNIVPDCWIYVQEPDVKMGRIQIFNNWSPYMVENPLENVWLGLEYFCKEGDEYWTMPEEEFCRFAINELEKMGIVDAENVLDFHCERVKKAYPAYFDTYSEMDTLIEYLNEIDNLYCVGRNGQHRYNNMDHSMATAFEAVKCIKTKNSDKKSIWNVNTEKEYHEEKK